MMKAPNVSLGLDVGGSHVTAGVVDMSFAGGRSMRLARKEMDSYGTASGIVAAISDCIREALAGEVPVAEIGIAFPGPFDYQKGVCTVLNVGGKFEQMFGLHLGQALKDATGMHGTAFRFYNDAHCFAVGAYARYALESKRTVFLTLGSGFGSSFMENGRLVTAHPALPVGCAFYNEPFWASVADDYFSTRWFHNAYRRATGEEVGGVRELAGIGSGAAKSIFEEFGTNLGEFLLPWLRKFKCDQLVIGGNIAKAGALFFNSLENQLKLLENEVNVMFCDDTEACVVGGAACLARQEDEAFAAAAEPDYISPYDINLLTARLQHEKTAVLDGSEVDSWEAVRQDLHQALTKSGRRVFWYDIDACLKAGADDKTPAGGLKNGIRSFDEAKIAALRPDTSADLCIVYGAGAGVSNWGGMPGKLR